MPVLAAALPGEVLIVELQTGGSGTGTAGQEFVKLYNNTPDSIDITGWKLQYRAASKLPTDTWPATSTTTIACPTGSVVDCAVVIAGHGHITLATTTMGLSATVNLNGGFADAGGQIRLLEPSGVIEDFIGYGAALDFEGAVAPKPAGGESLRRKVDATGNYIDTNNNASDFTLSCGAPSPSDARQPVASSADGCPLFELPIPEPEPPVPEPEPTVEPPAETLPPPEVPVPEPPTEPAPPEVPPVVEPPVEPEPPVVPPTADPEPTLPTPPTLEPEPTPTPTPTPPSVYLPLLITEVFPDPASPQTDAADEFVELFNPNPEAVDISGYVLKTGLVTQHIIALPAATLPAGGYMVIKSVDSTLSLVNTGTPVQLADPLGVMRDEAPNYQTALTGESWIKTDTGWQWSTTPTPGAVNIATQPIAPVEEDPEPTIPPVTEPPTEPAVEPPAVEAPGQGSGPVVYLPIRITELLPDPASPGQDTTDEFIEIYNPNPEAVNLKNYQLQSGTNFRYRYVLPDITLGPGEYLVIMSEESGLSLSNSGTAVRMLDPNLVVVDEVQSYGKAQEGQSWAIAQSGSWQWTTTLTPGAANQLTVPVKPVKAAAASTAKTTKKAATATKSKVATATKAKDTATSSDSPFVEPAAPPPNYWLLAGVGSMAAGYGIYEYRQGLLSGARRLWGLVRGKSAES